MNKWRTYKHKTTSNIVVEVSNGTQILIVSVTPYSLRQMTLVEFQRLISRLGEAIELYQT